MLMGCTPKQLVHSTVVYTTISSASLNRIGSAPSLATDLCERRAQLDFLSRRSLARGIPERPFDSYRVFRSTHRAKTLGDSAEITWEQTCKSYSVAEETFVSAVHALRSYAAALAGLATEDEANRSSVEAASNAVVSGIAALSATGKQYESSLGALGAPLGIVVDALKSRWKARHLARLVARTDPAVQTIIEKLRAYLEIVRSQQIQAVRDSYDNLHSQLVEIRLVGDQRLDAVSDAILDVTLEIELERTDRRAASMSRLLSEVASAHTALTDGWKDGRSAGDRTVKRLTEIAELIQKEAEAMERLGGL